MGDVLCVEDRRLVKSHRSTIHSRYFRRSALYKHLLAISFAAASSTASCAKLGWSVSETKDTASSSICYPNSHLIISLS